MLFTTDLKEISASVNLKMDGIFGFVKGFLGLPYNNPGANSRNSDDVPQGSPENEFRNPIWNMDDDDDDDDFREHVPNGPFGFRVFSNPLEIHRFFEHQMQEMLKQFQSLEPPSMFGEDRMPALTPPEDNRSLREQFLKRDLKDSPLPRYHTDSDLDDRVNAGELDKILQDKPSLHHPSSLVHSFGKSVSKKIIRLPDGRVEHHQTSRDSNGNEETSVTRQIGDKSYTVTTQIAVDGSRQQTESLVNMGEDELAEFKKKWETKLDTNPKPHSWFPIDKFLN